MGYDPEDFYDEFNDLDAMACANGDFNTWEDNQCFLDQCHDGYGDDCGDDY
jgi:hypothetical protein